LNVFVVELEHCITTSLPPNDIAVAVAAIEDVGDFKDAHSYEYERVGYR
jgi:hypothetical protein